MIPVVFFDGDCAFCTRAVRWVAKRDGGRFTFAPLGGTTFVGTFTADTRAVLPDSIVVLTDAGAVLTRGVAVRHILRSSPWPWRAVGGMMAAIPAALLNRGYDVVARHRRQVAPETCEAPSVAFKRRVLP